MYQPFRRLGVALAAAAVLGSSVVMAIPGLALATGQCPITINEQGSTTVYPALIQAQAGFQAATGCTLATVANGSGTGLTALLAYNNIGGTSTTVVNIAASSRPLKSGNEANNLYAFQIGGDAMVMAVKNDSTMSFISHLSMNDVQAIYSNTATTWNQINPAYPSTTILPRTRIVGSGSRDDLLRLFGVADDSAIVTRTGLPRLTTSNDEANAVCASDGDNQIVYTSLANLLTYGPAGSGCLKALDLSAGSSTSYITPSVTSVQNGTYPAPRQLFLVIPKFSVLGSAATTDNSANVKAFDLVNYMLSTAGQTAIAQVGFVNAPIPATQAIPDWDINLDGAVGLGDLGNITGRWGQTSSCAGWIRADVNNDGAVGLLDIGKVTAKWGGVGFVAP